MPADTKVTAPKLVSIRTTETSGVEHPAHEVEGWMLMKDRDGKAAGVFEAFRAAGSSTITGGTVPTRTEDKTPTLEELLKERETLTADLEKAKTDLVGATEWSTAVETQYGAKIAELEKSGTPAPAPIKDEFSDLPAEVQAVMRKSRDDAKTAHEAELKKERDRVDAIEAELRKEREIRETELEKQKIAGRGHLTIDADKSAVLLRKMREASPELATEIDALLDAVEEQAKSSATFLKSAGIFAPPGAGSAAATIEGARDEILRKAKEEGKELTKEAAFIQAVLANPDLAEEMRSGGDELRGAA